MHCRSFSQRSTMTGRFVIPQDSVLLLLVSCPNSQGSDLLRRYGAAHEVDIGLAVRCVGLFALAIHER